MYGNLLISYNLQATVSRRRMTSASQNRISYHIFTPHRYLLKNNTSASSL
jgi:hypothetical protein